MAVGCLLATSACTDDEKAPIVIYGCDPNSTPTGATGSGAGSGTGSGSGSGSGAGPSIGGTDGSGGSDSNGGSAGSGGSDPGGGDYCKAPWSEAVDPTSACDIANLPDSEETISGTISDDLTLESGKSYTLSGPTMVEAGATLTIPPCVKIVGESAEAVLVIRPGAKIEAEGEVDKPIVFTSAAAPGQRKSGDWGGLVLLGNAFNNQATPDTKPLIEGITGNELSYGSHAHDNDGESSGTLAYVRVEYVGKDIGNGNELNGITFGSIGSGTVLHHVMVANSIDDCFEWFGGTVNGHHLIALNCDDDMFDGDFGFSGKVQFAFGRQFPTTFETDSSGFELDTSPVPVEGQERTEASWSNVTLCGAPDNFDANRVGIVLRRGVGGSIDNTLIRGFSYGLSRRGIAGADVPTTSVKNTILSFADGKGDAYDSKNSLEDWFLEDSGNADNSIDAVAGFCNCWANPPVPFPQMTIEGGTPNGVDDANANYVGAFEAPTAEANWMNGAWVDWSDK